MSSACTKFLLDGSWIYHCWCFCLYCSQLILSQMLSSPMWIQSVVNWLVLEQQIILEGSKTGLISITPASHLSALKLKAWDLDWTYKGAVIAFEVPVEVAHKVISRFSIHFESLVTAVGNLLHFFCPFMFNKESLKSQFLGQETECPL